MNCEKKILYVGNNDTSVKVIKDKFEADLDKKGYELAVVTDTIKSAKMIKQVYQSSQDNLLLVFETKEDFKNIREYLKLKLPKWLNLSKDSIEQYFNYLLDREREIQRQENERIRISIVEGNQHGVLSKSPKPINKDAGTPIKNVDSSMLIGRAKKIEDLLNDIYVKSKKSVQT